MGDLIQRETADASPLRSQASAERDYDADLAAICREMDNDGDPRTPKEIAEHKAEMAVRDAWLAVTEACNLFKDPIARQFILRQRDDIRSMHTKLSFLAAAVEVTADRSAA